MTRKPLFWLLLASLSALALLFSWHFFSLAFPSLDLSVKMSRGEALVAAQTRARDLRLAAPDTRTAVRFYNHDEVQNFLELEGGGSTSVQSLQKGQIFPLRQWEVRFYKEGDAAYSTLYFSPQGQPRGFTRHVPEQQADSSLTASAAQQMAETLALKDWQLDLAPGHSPYVLVQQSQKTRPNGRIDHFFSYEHRDLRFGKQGEGRVRLDLGIAGRQFAQLRYSILVPESFSRRYAEMRAANNTLASVATLGFGLLYGLGGCVLGLTLLWRSGWVLTRPALLWASLIALLQGAASLNQIPGSWFQYDSALSARDFILQQVGTAVFGMVMNWLTLLISFMAAESLSRRAFGQFPQFWRIWSREALASKQVLGQTVGAYLWVGFDLAFIVAFYYCTRQFLGWWSPMESLIDPDVLATPLPWLTPVANALHAGFWEECLFRAVPLAGAALLGDYLQQQFHGRFGSRRSWLIFALILQALIFGGAHANYAQQPAYARPLELFLPALIWGLVYLRFGLLPGIIFHYVFDLLLMSLPVFATDAPGLWPDRAIIIACALAPLAMVLWQRLRAGQWRELPEQLLNRAWQAQLPPLTETTPQHDRPANPAPWLMLRRILPLLGLGGILLWTLLPNPAPAALPFAVTRDAATALADAALAERGIHPGPGWHRFSQVSANPADGESFIWKTAGRAAWQRLRGHYIPPLVWQVRYVSFAGDVVQRAEEWIVNVEDGVDGQGGGAHVRGVVHRLPESARATTLSEQQARSVAQSALLTRFGPVAAGWREISAQEVKQPQRKDWQFTFADDAASPLKTGEARVELTLAGDEVTQIRRTIHETEAWQRQQRNRGALMQTVRIGMALMLVALAIGSLLLAIRQKQGLKVSRRPGLVAAIIIATLMLASYANNWQGLAMQLKTDQPLLIQLGTTAVGLGVSMALLGALCGLLLNFSQQAAAMGKLGTGQSSPWWPGLALAALLAGLQALFAQWISQPVPALPGTGILNNTLPALAECTGALLHVLMFGNLLVLLLAQLHDFSANFSRRQLPTILICLLLGLTSAMQQDEIAQFLLQGLGAGLLLCGLYLLVARFEAKVLLVALVGMLALSKLRFGLSAPWPGALTLALVHIGALLLTARLWLNVLKRARTDTN